jgi:hypothetical protein
MSNTEAEMKVEKSFRTHSREGIHATGKAKTIIVPVHATKAYRRSTGIAPPILNLGTK